MLHKRAMWVALACCCAVLSSVFHSAEAGVYHHSLNGWELGIDEATGGLVFLSHSTTGAILEAAPGAAGLLDVAYPVQAFLPMRLATQFSKAQQYKIILKPK